MTDSEWAIIQPLFGPPASAGANLENRNVLVNYIRNCRFAETWLLSDDQVRG
jgi:hypothetical protein